MSLTLHIEIDETPIETITGVPHIPGDNVQQVLEAAYVANPSLSKVLSFSAQYWGTLGYELLMLDAVSNQDAADGTFLFWELLLTAPSPRQASTRRSPKTATQSRGATPSTRPSVTTVRTTKAFASCDDGRSHRCWGTGSWLSDERRRRIASSRASSSSGTQGPRPALGVGHAPRLRPRDRAPQPRVGSMRMLVDVAHQHRAGPRAAAQQGCSKRDVAAAGDVCRRRP